MKEVSYSVVLRKNLVDKTQPAKYYAQAQASGDVGVDEIATRVERACTVHKADIAAVLKALEDEVIEGLQRGEIVRLGDIGTFQIGLKSEGVEKEEDFKATQIRKAKINFRPGSILANAIKTLSYGKVSTRAAAKKKPDDSGEGGDSGEVVDPKA